MVSISQLSQLDRRFIGRKLCHHIVQVAVDKESTLTMQWQNV